MRYIRLLKEPRKIEPSIICELKNRIEEFAKKFELSLFYVFGSLAKDGLRPLSDVDIAVRLEANRQLGLEEYSSLLSEIQDIFDREDIDLVDLKTASPLLKMRIIQEGKLVYSKDKESLARFRYETFNSYLRTSYLRKDFFNYVKKAVVGRLQ